MGQTAYLFRWSFGGFAYVDVVSADSTPMPRLSNSTAARVAIQATKKRAAAHLRALLEYAERDIDIEIDATPPTVISLIEPTIEDEANWIDVDSSDGFDEKVEAFLDLDATNTDERDWLLSNG